MGSGMVKNFFITGRKRTGKSTLLKSFIDPRRDKTGGYFVQRLFIKGDSRAFRLVDITREEYIPNREVTTLEGLTDLIAVTGKRKQEYLEVFKTIGVGTLHRGCREKQLVLMDELGRLESAVPEFMQAVWHVLDHPVPVIGVIKKEPNPFLDQVRARWDVYVVDMDFYGPEATYDQLQRFFAELKF